MKKIITCIVSFLFIILFLASSTGISFVIHHCYTAQKEHIRLFAATYKCKTETEQSKISCCCARHTISSEDKSLMHLRNSDCCKNTYKFLKISYQYENGFIKVKQIVSFSRAILNNFTLLYDFNITEINHHLYHPPPLLLSGRYLIHFIHNLKIPFPSYC